MASKKDKKKPKKSKGELVISAPTGPMQHRVHVDRDYTWNLANVEEEFELLNVCGKGGFGIVYKARNRSTSSVLAIKTVKVEGNTIGDEVMREISILRALKHPNIVQYFGCVKNQDSLWILMDFCGVGAVTNLMKKIPRPLSEPAIASILRGVLLGLLYLHTKKAIHRDLKGQNILLTEAGEVKLADFGISKQLEDATGKAKTVVGTMCFMSPEVLSGTPYSFEADIWSLGITALELAEGKAPFADMHPVRLVFMITEQDPPEPSNPASWSPEFLDFLHKCLKRDPAERAPVTELLKHPFILNAKDSTETLTPLVQEFIALRTSSEEANGGGSKSGDSGGSAGSGGSSGGEKPSDKPKAAKTEGGIKGVRLSELKNNNRTN